MPDPPGPPASHTIGEPGWRAVDGIRTNASSISRPPRAARFSRTRIRPRSARSEGAPHGETIGKGSQRIAGRDAGGAASLPAPETEAALDAAADSAETETREEMRTARTSPRIATSPASTRRYGRPRRVFRILRARIFRRAHAGNSSVGTPR